MQFQPELPQTVPPILEESLCFRSLLKPQHHVVRITNHDNLAHGSVRPPVLDPKIENVMQVYIRKQRRNHRTLRSPLFRLRPLSIFEDAGLQPLLDQAKDPSILEAIRVDGELKPETEKKMIAFLDNFSKSFG